LRLAIAEENKQSVEEKRWLGFENMIISDWEPHEDSKEMRSIEVDYVR